MDNNAPKKILNGLNNANIVEKSRPLVLMKAVPFALGELKILDTYCSRINARDPSATTVRFSKEEYENLMGIERMHPSRLGKYVDSMMGKVITVPEDSGWKKYTLFSYSECSQDEHGQWWIDLSCTPEAKRLFFNIEGIGYIRYQLKNVLPLTSKYSVLLYIYLLDNRFRKDWTVSVDKLRQDVLRCNSKFYCESYKDFRRDILLKALKEVNEKTDLTFAMDQVKTGRRITDIRWTLLKDDVILPSLPDKQAAAVIDNCEIEAHVEDIDDSRDLWRDALSPYEFTPEEIDEIQMCARKNVLSNTNFFLAPADLNLKIYEYLSDVVRYVRVRETQIKIKNLYKYFLKCVKEDVVS